MSSTTYNLVQSGASFWTQYGIEFREVAGLTSPDTQLQMFVVSVRGESRMQPMWSLQGHSSSNAHAYDIQMNSTTNVWKDYGFDYPTHFELSNSTTHNTSNASNLSSGYQGTITNKYLHIYISQSGSLNYIGYIDISPPQSTNSEGLSYSGTLTVNGSNLDYEIPSSASAGTYQILSKVLPYGNFLLELSFTHSEGTASTGSAVNFDSLKQWILRSPLGDVLDSSGASPASLKVFRNFW